MAEIGRLLRRTRTRQGLRLEEVALHTGLAVSELEALETGAVTQIPDRVAIVKTLRRYGDALGLPGDRLGLALIDLWPAPGAVSSLSALPETEAVLVGSTNGEGRHRDLDTAAIPQIFLEDEPTASHPAGPPPLSGAFVDTGVNAAVGGSASVPARKSRPRRAPVALRLLVAAVGLAVVLGSAGLVAYALRPSWFHQLGIGGSNTPPTSPGPTSTHKPPAGPARPSVSAVTVSSTGFDTATVTVQGTNPTVRVSAVGGDCWVSVTAPGQGNPLFADVLSSGSQQDFPLGQSLTIELGSGAGKTYLLQGSRILGSYVPPNAPFTVTFNPAS